MAEKYKANSNGEVVPKTQDEINSENNANTIKNAADVAIASKNPYAMAAGYAVKGLDKVTGGKTTQKLGEQMTKINKTSPGGKILQNASNKLAESGAGDAIGSAASMKNGASSGGANAAGKMANNNSNIQNNTKPSNMSNNLKNAPNNNVSNNAKKTSDSDNGDNGNFGNSLFKDLGSNSLGNMLFKAVGKKYIIIGAVIFFVFILLMTAIVSAKDFGNLDLTNNAESIIGTGGTRLCTDEELESSLIYVGDSRMVGMKSTLSSSNVKIIAKSAMGLNWLKNTASSELDSTIQNNEDSIIVLCLGANDLYNIDNYITYYKELMDKYSNNTFFVLSVNPVDEAKAVANGYTGIKNTDIDAFNDKLKSSFGDKYIDSNSTLSSIGSSDGVHYDNDTNKNIHSAILSGINSSGKVACGAAGDLNVSLETVAKWYIENVNTYQNSTSGKGTGSRKYYKTPFGERKFGDDCTEFVAAYMSFISGTDIPESYSGGMVDPNGSWAKSVESSGWKAYSSDEIGNLQMGDVLIAHSGALYSTKGHHGEVYINESQTFGWGSIKKSYPTSNTITKSEENGHIHFRDATHDYITIYRYEGTINSSGSNSGDSSLSSLNITKMYDSSFNHGTKSKSNQKYIMLHDTAMPQNAKTVIQSWKNGNGVAAHFVIDRDGTVIQAVDLDVIAHHAGWGGPGNYDAKFGVGNNDGKGNGDDLKGSTKPSSKYTSYGMNSYSIGIEMCHVTGETYPEAQLKALDSIIAYIDSYYGFKSEIIDHKAWRPSNGDTDANFATYFNNYKTLRHH